jgi:hypothetical protein
MAVGDSVNRPPAAGEPLRLAAKLFSVFFLPFPPLLPLLLLQCKAKFSSKIFTSPDDFSAIFEATVKQRVQEKSK